MSLVDNIILLCYNQFYKQFVHIISKKRGMVFMNENIVKDIRFYTNRSLKTCSPLPEMKISFYDLTFLIEGKMSYKINGEYIWLNKNDTIIIPPGSLRMRFRTDNFVKYASFNFTLADDSFLPTDLLLKDSITNNIYKLLSLFPVEYRHHSIRAEKYIQPSLYSLEKLKNILNLILLEIKDTTKHESSNRHILNIIQYIESHIYEPITLDLISKKFQFSKEYISSLFKKETGKNISNYIIESKMNHALQMIRDSNMSLNEICENLGYNSYSYFSRCFKKTFNCSPKKMQFTVMNNNKK